MNTSAIKLIHQYQQNTQQGQQPCRVWQTRNNDSKSVNKMYGQNPIVVEISGKKVDGQSGNIKSCFDQPKYSHTIIQSGQTNQKLLSGSFEILNNDNTSSRGQNNSRTASIQGGGVYNQNEQSLIGRLNQQLKVMNTKLNRINLNDQPAHTTQQIVNVNSNANLNLNHNMSSNLTFDNDYTYSGGRRIRGSASQLNRSLDIRENSEKRRSQMKTDISKSLIPKLENIFMDDGNYFDASIHRLQKVTSLDSFQNNQHINRMIRIEQKSSRDQYQPNSAVVNATESGQLDQTQQNFNTNASKQLIRTFNQSYVIATGSKKSSRDVNSNKLEKYDKYDKIKYFNEQLYNEKSNSNLKQIQNNRIQAATTVQQKQLEANQQRTFDSKLDEYKQQQIQIINKSQSHIEQFEYNQSVINQMLINRMALTQSSDITPLSGQVSQMNSKQMLGLQNTFSGYNPNQTYTVTVVAQGDNRDTGNKRNTQMRGKLSSMIPNSSINPKTQMQRQQINSSKKVGRNALQQSHVCTYQQGQTTLNGGNLHTILGLREPPQYARDGEIYPLIQLESPSNFNSSFNVTNIGATNQSNSHETTNQISKADTGTENTTEQLSSSQQKRQMSQTNNYLNDATKEAIQNANMKIKRINNMEQLAESRNAHGTSFGLNNGQPQQNQQTDVLKRNPFTSGRQTAFEQSQSLNSKDQSESQMNQTKVDYNKLSLKNSGFQRKSSINDVSFSQRSLSQLLSTTQDQSEQNMSLNKKMDGLNFQTYQNQQPTQAQTYVMNSSLRTQLSNPNHQKGQQDAAGGQQQRKYVQDRDQEYVQELTNEQILYQNKKIHELILAQLEKNKQKEVPSDGNMQFLHQNLMKINQNQINIQITENNKHTYQQRVNKEWSSRMQQSPKLPSIKEKAIASQAHIDPKTSGTADQQQYINHLKNMTSANFTASQQTQNFPSVEDFLMQRLLKKDQSQNIPDSA